MQNSFGIIGVLKQFMFDFDYFMRWNLQICPRIVRKLTRMDIRLEKWWSGQQPPSNLSLCTVIWNWCPTMVCAFSVFSGSPLYLINSFQNSAKKKNCCTSFRCWCRRLVMLMNKYLARPLCYNKPGLAVFQSVWYVACKRDKCGNYISYIFEIQLEAD